MTNKSIPKSLLALLLTLSLICTSGVFNPVGGLDASAEEVQSGAYVSRLVTGENGPYIEYLGEPYLVYSMQVRADWYMDDKGRLSAAERAEYGLPEVDYNQNNSAYTAEQKAKYFEIVNTLRDEFMDEVFRKVKEDGFNSVNIPIYWSTVETSQGVYDFSRLQYYYTFLEKYDLTVQWLWFGTNVCGGGSLTPAYIRNDTDTYKHVYPENYTGEGVWFDFSCEATMKAEQNALAAMMEWLAKNDTHRRCVMIQVNNEVDQGADTFEKYAEGGTASSPYWYSSDSEHDKYCWTGGQRTALFAQLSALGDVIHNSSYNCVTRVNFSGAGRNMGGISDDVTDLVATTGIDIVGEDIYFQDWQYIDSYLQPKSDSNLTHLAECSTTYDYTNIAGKIFSIGGGFMPYCYRDDRIAGGGEGIYINAQEAKPVQGADESDEDYAVRLKEYEDNAYWEGRTYREWVEREGVTDAVRNFNRLINNMYKPLAKAVAERKVAEFNGEHDQTTVNETQTFAGQSITYASDNDGLGMMLNTASDEFVLIATKGGTYTFNTDETVCFQSGVYEDKYWVPDSTQVISDGNTVTVSAGQIVKAWVGLEAPPAAEAPTYEVFGETKEYSLSGSDETDGFEVITDDSINSASGIVKNKSAAAQQVILSESAKNFKISFNYNVGDYKDTVIVTMPDNCQFHVGRWQKPQIMAIVEGKEICKDQYAGTNDGKWHRVEIIKYDDRITFLLDGACFYKGTLSKSSTAGELSVTLGESAAISDLVVSNATLEDASVIINADYSQAPFEKLALSGKGTYDKDAGTLSLTPNMQTPVEFYYYNSNNTWTEKVKDYSKVKNYTFEAEFINIILGALFLAGYLLCPDVPFLSPLLLMFAVVGFMTAMMNGIPMRMGTVDNDGYNAFALSKNKEAVEAFWVQFKVGAQSSKGIRLKDMPAEWFAVPTDTAMKNSMVATRCVFTCNRLMDEEKFEEADALMAHLLEIESGIVGLHHDLLMCDRIFVELIGENRREVIQDIPIQAACFISNGAE